MWADTPLHRAFDGASQFSTLGVALLPMMPEVLVKAVVDTGLFFVSYWIQRTKVF